MDCIVHFVKTGEFIIGIIIGLGIGFFTATLSYHKAIDFINHHLKKFSIGEWGIIIVPWVIWALVILFCHANNSYYTPINNDTKMKIIQLIIKISENLPNCFLGIILLLFTYAVIFFCPDLREFELKEYVPKIYAELQSKKTEYAFLGGIVSLGSVVKGTNSIEFLCFIGYIITLLGIGYRHLIYAITMQEAKKKLYEIEYENHLNHKK